MTTEKLRIWPWIVLAVFGCGPAVYAQVPDKPIIVIFQVGGLPDNDPRHQSGRGLVVALWNDGRLIRAASSDTVGKSYIQGAVEESSRGRLIQTLLGNEMLRTPTLSGYPIDIPAQSIVVRDSGSISRWLRMLPDPDSAWNGFQSQLLEVPLLSVKPADAAAVIAAERYAEVNNATR